MTPVDDILANADAMTVEQIQAHKNDRDDAVKALRAENGRLHQALIQKVTQERGKLAVDIRDQIIGGK